ncbi:serine/threonine-protein kinase N2-like [Pelobates fuscus]|uniref:serine/threonine-protein kinase N2-like n=1 Tax=Pelobates fuscus TaxID=191477 RepID=UPI002FE44B60
MANRNIFSCFPRLRFRNRARRQIPDDVEQKVDRLPEIRDAPKGDTSSQTENAKLSALQKKLDIELKVKQGAENLVKAYSNDPPKNAKHIAAAQKKLKRSEKKIAKLRSRIQSLIKEQPSLPAPETDINTVAPSLLVTDTQEPEPAGTPVNSAFCQAGCESALDITQEAQNVEFYTVQRHRNRQLYDFPILPLKPITLPDVEHDFETPSQTISAYIKIQNILAQLARGQIPDDVEQKVDQLPEISDAPTSDTSSQADNVKLSALQKQLDIELKVKQGAENLVKAYSNDPPKNVHHIAAVQEILQDSENKIANLRSQIQSLIKEQPSLPAPETDINTVAPSLLVTDTQEPEPAGDFPIFPMKAIVLPDVELDLEMPPAPSQTVLDNIQHDISVYIEVPDFLAQDYEEGHKYTSDNEHITANPTPDVIREPDRTVSPLDNSIREPSKTSKDVRIRPRIPLAMEDFKLRSVLGRGSFGKVLLAKYKNTNKMYALKVMRKGDIESSPKLDSLLCEKRVFQAVTNRRYPFLINLFGCFHTQDHIIFAMEYAAGGDLSTLLNNKRRPFPESRAIFFSACVVLGLEFLHEQKIVHRDLKLENIVLDEKGFAKITDFGLCKEGIGYGDTTGSPRGTPHYVAPEVCKGKPYTRAVDWWSFGVVIYVMLSGKFPFESHDLKKLTASIIKGKFICPESLSRNSTSIIKQVSRHMFRV